MSDPASIETWAHYKCGCGQTHYEGSRAYAAHIEDRGARIAEFRARRTAAKQTRYELWDRDTGNVIGTAPTLQGIIDQVFAYGQANPTLGSELSVCYWSGGALFRLVES